MQSHCSIPVSVLFNPHLSPGAKVLYFASLIPDSAQTQEQLAKTLGLGERTVRRHQKELRAAGLLSRRGGWVYLVKCEGFYKIGSAADLAKRLDGYRTSSPFELQLIASARVGDCVGLERELQSHFAERRVRGEWYALTPSEVEDIRAIFALAGNSPVDNYVADSER